MALCRFTPEPFWPTYLLPLTLGRLGTGEITTPFHFSITDLCIGTGVHTFKVEIFIGIIMEFVLNFQLTIRVAVVQSVM